MAEKENWDEVWVFVEAHEPEFRRWARIGESYLQSRGLGPADAQDLIHSFILEQLPAILEKFERASLRGSRLGYVRSSFQNYVRMGARKTTVRTKALAQLEALERSQPRREHEQILEGRYRSAPLFSKDLDIVLDDLDTAEGAALRAYLGTGEEKPRSIRQVAKQLDVSRHRARQLIVDGFLSAAIKLDERGALSAIDLRVCELVVLDGGSIEEVSEQLDLSAKAVKDALERARNLVGHFIH